jgi:hypothetical protein
MKWNRYNIVVSSSFSQEQSLLFLSALDGTTEKGTTSRFALLNRWDGIGKNRWKPSTRNITGSWLRPQWHGMVREAAQWSVCGLRSNGFLLAIRWTIWANPGRWVVTPVPEFRIPSRPTPFHSSFLIKATTQDIFTPFYRLFELSHFVLLSFEKYII